MLFKKEDYQLALKEVREKPWEYYVHHCLFGMFGDSGLNDTLDTLMAWKRFFDIKPEYVENQLKFILKSLVHVMGSYYDDTKMPERLEAMLLVHEDYLSNLNCEGVDREKLEDEVRCMSWNFSEVRDLVPNEKPEPYEVELFLLHMQKYILHVEKVYHYFKAWKKQQE